MSAYGTKRTSERRPAMSAFGGKAESMAGNQSSDFQLAIFQDSTASSSVTIFRCVSDDSRC
jgi:hypothetical protein